MGNYRNVQTYIFGNIVRRKLGEHFGVESLLFPLSYLWTLNT